MKLKVDANGVPEVKDGFPVWVMPDGSEVAYDVPKLHQTIGALRDEAKTHRLEKEDAIKKLTTFGDIDPEAARKALQFAQTMEGKKAMDDESIKQLITNAVKPLQEQLAEKEKVLSEKEGSIYKLTVGNKFATSEFLQKNTLLTPDAAELLFGKHFKVEGDKIIPQDANGNPIYSRKNPVEMAGFDEALSVIYEGYDYREQYRKGSGASGAGTKGTNGSGGYTGSIRSRADFKSDSDKAKFIGENGLDAFKALPPS